jgi:prephenate dehydratase
MEASMTPRFKSLATLGDPPINNLTSSFYVAEKRELAQGILGLESFEAAIDAVKTGKAEVALIAGAYPKIRDFIMDASLTCIDSFIEQIPPLVLTGVQPSLPSSIETIYLHPATIPLLPKVSTRYDKTVETKATSAAAAKAKNDPQSLAICNKLAADYYGLNIHQILHPVLNMPFALFQIAPR